MKLQDNSTHFQCAGCNKIKLIEYGHITKVAYSICSRDTQDKFYYNPYYVMLCDKCFEGEEKNDGNNNS